METNGSVHVTIIIVSFDLTNTLDSFLHHVSQFRFKIHLKLIQEKYNKMRSFIS